MGKHQQKSLEYLKKMKPLTSLCYILLFALESSIIINACFAGSKINVIGSKGQEPGANDKLVFTIIKQTQF